MTTRVILLYGCIIALAVSGCKGKSEKPAEGKVKRETISFTPKVTGRILKLYVQEGQQVHPGDTLAMLDVPEVSAKIAQAKGVVKATTAQQQLANNGATPNQIKQLRAKYSALKEQYDFARKSYSRANAMFADSMMAPQAHDEAFAKFQGAKSQLDAVSAELNEVLKGTRYETKEATAGQQQQASGVLQEAEVAYSERYIIATNNMQIETISLHEGELATAGYALFNGYIPASTYFRFTIPESQISNYKQGQELKVNIPYAKQEINGRIATIKQLARYADITAAYPDYQMEEAIYEIKLVPADKNAAAKLLANSTAILQK
jgi:HlyD family secretion protein